MDESIDKLIKDETSHRLAEMSSPSYIFPEKANKVDFIGIIAIIIICLCFIILCMTGVIV